MSKHPPKDLDRRFPHIGRIKRAWGTDHVPTRRRMVEMLDTLYSMGNWEPLRGLQGPKPIHTPLEVYAYYRTGELDRLPTAKTLAPLKQEMEKWIAKKECSDPHRRSLMQSKRHIVQSAKGTASVGDLASLLTSLREKMQGKHPRSFNLARAAAQAFAKTTAGRNSKLWSDISQVEVLRVTPQRRKNPLTPKELDAITSQMPDPYGQMAVDMALTGMGPSEYWGDWEMKPGRIVIHGTKRKGRERVVPNISGASMPLTEYAAFRRALRAASKGMVRPYDLRRTYANLLESAGIPRTRRKMYMGHGAKDVTDLYERHEVERYLTEDAEKLREYIYGATERPWLKLEKA